MAISYIRPDKNFEGVYDQLKMVNAYIEREGLPLEREMIDQTSQNRRLMERNEVVSTFRAFDNETLVIYDVWVLSTHIEDLVQMFSCLLKKRVTLHIVRPSVVITFESDLMLVLGLIDQLRQTLQLQEEKRAIGRPKGSRSSSKFDKFQDVIVKFLRDNRSVSEMARELGVSRSSLKDYIESRELREVAVGVKPYAVSENAEADVINTIKCPEEQ